MKTEFKKYFLLASILFFAISSAMAQTTSSDYDEAGIVMGKPQESVSKAYAYVKETFFYPYTPGKARARVKREKIEQNRRDYMDETILYSQELSKKFLEETQPSLNEKVEILKKGKSEASDLRSGVALGTGGLFLKMQAEMKSLELETALIEMELYPLLLSTDVYFREDLSTLSQTTAASASAGSSGGSFWDKATSFAGQVQDGFGKVQETVDQASEVYNDAKEIYDESKEVVDMAKEGNWQGIADKTGASDFIDEQADKGAKVIEGKINTGIREFENNMTGKQSEEQ